MKTCTYCGRASEDQATRCGECGTEFAAVQAQDAPKESSAEKLERIAVLDNEVQAEWVDAVLSDRETPHLMQSYYDSALDGIFQAQKGWGVILAPPDFKNDILAVLEDFKRQFQSPPSDLDGNP